jgi:hypothetical protein
MCGKDPLASGLRSRIAPPNEGGATHCKTVERGIVAEFCFPLCDETKKQLVR